MRLPIYQLDAFATRRFRGNPAAVVVVGGASLPDDALRDIAAENNLSETAFVTGAESGYALRWFTPTTEVPLCGHATLAAAAVVLERLEPGRRDVTFASPSGPLHVTRRDGRYAMDFPARPVEPIPPPAGMASALGSEPVEVHGNAFNYLALLSSDAEVRRLAPDLRGVAELDRPGVIVTARAEPPYDIVSRYFAPRKGIPEDPVTGGAHCSLAPFWAPRLGTPVLRAVQASERGGELVCTLAGDRVTLEGGCVFYLQGEIEL
jgi:PhzF family phenazine biosynthesis protein